ncbi:hypothetical protein L9F63_023988, partial [Diploptera punctata]
YPTNFCQFRLIFLRHKIMDCRSGRRECCLTGETPYLKKIHSEASRGYMVSPKKE